MKYTSKIQKVGSSLYILVPSNLVNVIKIDKNDIVEVDIKKLTNSNIKSYRCIICNNFFDMESTEPYCPICGNEDSYSIEVLSKNEM